MSKRLSDIMNLEIINVYNGGKYGYIGDCDMIFDKNTGEIIAIGVLESGGRSLFFKDNDLIEIPWSSKMKVFDKTIIFDHRV